VRDGKAVEYQTIVQETSDLLISHESCVGLGNAVFHASWLTEMFSLAASCEYESFNAMISHLFLV
jgi:hypothetical protein